MEKVSNQVIVSCIVDCSQVDYCILFSSAPIDGKSFFECPKDACIDIADTAESMRQIAFGAKS